MQLREEIKLLNRQKKQKGSEIESVGEMHE